MVILFLFLVLPVCWVVYRVLFPRADMYVYFEIDGQRRKVFVGYLRHDFWIIDTTKPILERRVGQVVVSNGKGIVRIFRPDHQGEFDEVGCVDAQGDIYEYVASETPSGRSDQKISHVSPVGKRKWYELWLRLHSEVEDNVPIPFGACTEYLRFKGPTPNSPTLLARAGAALELYRRRAVTEDEYADLQPRHFRDIVFPASVIFASLYPLVGWIKLINSRYVWFPFVGVELSFVLAMLCVFGAIVWLASMAKTYLLSQGDEITEWLELINRQTGIRKWSVVGLGLSLAGILWGVFVDSYVYVPLFVALFLGFLASLGARSARWYIEPLEQTRPSLPKVDPNDEKGTNVDFTWTLDSPLNKISLRTSVRFDEQEIKLARETNPFNTSSGSMIGQSKAVSRRMVIEGEKAAQVGSVARYIARITETHGLARIEEIQAALDFVQDENIKYKLDSECDEIGNPAEYFRWPVETLYDRQGDCDCKAVLAAALLRRLGYPVLLLLSVEEQHAAIAVGGLQTRIPFGNDLALEYNGSRYHFCETTGDNWKIGDTTEGAKRMLLDRDAIVELTKDFLSLDE